MNFLNILKNIFFLLLFLQFTPPLIEGITKQYSTYFTPKTKVGVIPFKEAISDSNDYNKLLHDYFQNNDIKAILLKIDCSGGAAASSQAIHNELKLLKKEYPKPVIVLVENTCTSGGYYIASAADYIIAPGSALIGNIGVCLPNIFQVRELLDQIKVRYVPVKAGTFKTVGDPFVDMTPQEKALLQDILQDSYEQFIQDVALNRSLSPSTLTVWADGKIFSGKQAHTLGLIDEIGSAYNAYKVIREKALIEGDIEWVHPPENNSLVNLITGSTPHHEEDSLFSSCGYMSQTLYRLLHNLTSHTLGRDIKLTY